MPIFGNAGTVTKQLNALPAADFSMLKPGSAATGALLGNAFAGPASGTSIGPSGTDASTSGPNYGVGGAQSYSPAIQLGGSYTPDYNALIQNDPSLIAYRGNEQQSLDQATAARQAAVRALAVQYGGLPSSVNDVYGDVDPTTLALGKQNQYSDEANLSKNYDQTVLGIKRSLAARGALHSGDLSYGLDQANTARGQQDYTLANNFGNALQSALGNYTSTVNNVKQQEASAISQAAQNVYSNPAYRPSDATMANYLDGSYEKYGQALYQGADGKLYDGSGQVYSGGSGGAPPSGGTSAPPPVSVSGGEIPASVSGSAQYGPTHFGGPDIPSTVSGTGTFLNIPQTVSGSAAYNATQPFGSNAQRRRNQ